MVLKSRTIRNGLFALITISLISASAVAYLATLHISNDDSRSLITAKIISKASIMRILDQYERYFGAGTYAPTPFDSPDFAYADLSNPYFKKIRNDERVAHFYPNHGAPIDFSDAVSMAEFLRDLFPHGTSHKDYLNANVLEMMDAAEHGERFLCGNMSKMLAELVQAGGTQARTICLEDSSNNGHVVLEVWSRRFNKWAIIDPDYNVHYANATGTPLSALELYQISQDWNGIEDIRRVAGNSPNTLHNSNTKLIELFYRNGFAIYFYNRWVDANFPRRHPARSPSIMGYYVGNSGLRRLYSKHDSGTLTDDIISILYREP